MGAHLDARRRNIARAGRTMTLQRTSGTFPSVRSSSSFRYRKSGWIPFSSSSLTWPVAFASQMRARSFSAPRSSISLRTASVIRRPRE